MVQSSLPSPVTDYLQRAALGNARVVPLTGDASDRGTAYHVFERRSELRCQLPVGDEHHTDHNVYWSDRSWERSRYLVQRET